ncbi:MAG: hypothetical protein HC849_06930 [Oscillatoriales cyanobacterium RU_3_3]|nr:hypothetical protein [Microcoleus sp. SU_5_6]NJM59970.1 hypothetical protein [Oscillatoriales cyanobacterium RU_3_3]
MTVDILFVRSIAYIAVATGVKTYRSRSVSYGESSTKLNVQSFQSRSLVTADG